MPCTDHECLKQQFDLRESLDQAANNLMDRLNAIEQSIRLLGIDPAAVATTILTGAMGEKSIEITKHLGMTADGAVPCSDGGPHIYREGGFVETVLDRLDAIEKRLGIARSLQDQPGPFPHAMGVSGGEISSIVGGTHIRLELLDSKSELQNVGYFIRGKAEWDEYERRRLESAGTGVIPSSSPNWQTIPVHGEEDFHRYQSALRKGGYFGQCEFEPL